MKKNTTHLVFGFTGTSLHEVAQVMGQALGVPLQERNNVCGDYYKQKDSSREESICIQENYSESEECWEYEEHRESEIILYVSWVMSTGRADEIQSIILKKVEGAILLERKVKPLLTYDTYGFSKMRLKRVIQFVQDRLGFTFPPRKSWCENYMCENELGERFILEKSGIFESDLLEWLFRKRKVIFRVQGTTREDEIKSLLTEDKKGIELLKRETS